MNESDEYKSSLKYLLEKWKDPVSYLESRDQEASIDVDLLEALIPVDDVLDVYTTQFKFCHFFVDGIHKIADNLYITSVPFAKQYDMLRELGIDQIISLDPCTDHGNQPDFQVLHINIPDMHYVNIWRYLSTTYDFIDRGKCTLVHCVAGVSRSATICIAYLMKSRNISVKQAYAICKCKRYVINPNLGFMLQLLAYQAKLN
jgi:hypothetical protein